MSDTWYEEVDQEDVLLTTSSTGRYFVTYVTCTYVINMFIQSINDTAGGAGCVYLNQYLVKVLGVCARPRVCPRTCPRVRDTTTRRRIAIGSVSFDRSFDSPRIARRTRGAIRGDTARRESTSGRAREELSFLFVCVVVANARGRGEPVVGTGAGRSTDGRRARVAAQPPEGGGRARCVCVPKRG